MKSKDNALIAVYSYQNGIGILEKKIHDASLSSYYILYVLDESAEVDEDIIFKEFFDMYGNRSLINRQIGPFEHLDELKKFLSHVAAKFNIQKIQLVSTSEYNSLLEECNTLEDIKSALLTGGTRIENSTVKKSGLFGKLFDF